MFPQPGFHIIALQHAASANLPWAGRETDLLNNINYYRLFLYGIDILLSFEIT